jgi:hypothetical protein
VPGEGLAGAGAAVRGEEGLLRLLRLVPHILIDLLRIDPELLEALDFHLEVCTWQFSPHLHVQASDLAGRFTKE